MSRKKKVVSLCNCGSRTTSKKRIGSLKKGSLGKYGVKNVMQLTDKQYYTGLNKAVKSLGSSTVIRKLNAVAILTKNTKPKLSARFKKGIRHIQTKFRSQTKLKLRSRVKPNSKSKTHTRSRLRLKSKVHNRSKSKSIVRAKSKSRSRSKSYLNSKFKSPVFRQDFAYGSSTSVRGDYGIHRFNPTHPKPRYLQKVIARG